MDNDSTSTKFSFPVSSCGTCVYCVPTVPSLSGHDRFRKSYSGYNERIPLYTQKMGDNGGVDSSIREILKEKWAEQSNSSVFNFR